jgi:16S rRNA (cytidine1402-2'-O)-methyltransferase
MLYLVSTPIGNLEDITDRAKRTLKDVDLVLAEDTRKSGILLKSLGIKKSFLSFHDHNEVQRIAQIVSELKKGKKIALISSAGTPTISDPGYKLVRECRREGIEVTAIPGPSSIINALSLSSLPHEKFVFLGYLPRKKNQLKETLEEVKDFSGAVVFFESPYRVAKTLEIVKDVMGDKRVALAREMTKKFEEIIECRVTEAIEELKKKEPRGEFTIIIDNKS